MKNGFLKNYTSDVPVAQTIYSIEQVLIRCGVSSIEKEYGQIPGQVTAVRFSISIANGAPMRVRMPAKVQECWDALWLEYCGTDKPNRPADGNEYIAWGNKKKRKNDFKQQAERTAWRLMKDWIEVQMSMIQMKQAETLEVFMSYLWDGNRTFFARLRDSGFRALLPEKTE